MNESDWKCDYCIYNGQFCVLPIGHLGDHSSYTAAEQEQLKRGLTTVTEFKTWTYAEARKLLQMSLPAALPKFEHKIIELRLYATEAELDVLGDEGWRLVSESLHEDQVRYVFCRAKQP